MKHRSCSHTLSWVMMLLAVAPLKGNLLAAPNMGDPSPLLADLGAPPAPPGQEQPEVLSRGPVHEAFAEPVSMNVQSGLTAPEAPPPSIDEVPPPDRPEGRQYVWIPGYWSWDADRNGYIWVSACWRAAPPNMSWVPGYWSRSPGGWEWVAGYWAPADAREIEYLPPPPTVDNLEPIEAAPYEDTIWVPPCMYWVRGQYVRRSGYWLAAQPNWVWVPSHYVATPRGHIFATGHWDYAFERRGMLFAPLYFPSPLYRRPGFFFSHNIVLDVGLLRLSLFAYPRYNHYFFGDYYDDAYLRIGIFPWFDSGRHHSWYDPVFEHERWRHRRNEPRWEEHRRSDYARFRSDIALRPARTFREQENRLSKLPEPQRRAHQMAQPIAVAVARRETPFKFERINKVEQQQISRQATSVRTFRDERSRWESDASKRQTAVPLRERGTAVTPPAERRETVQPPRERGPAVTPPAARREPAAQPPRERGPAVTPPREHGIVTPPRERGATITPPAPRRLPAVQAPGERGGTVPTPAAPRGPAAAQPRSVPAPRAERVQIPAPPITGRSGSSGLSGLFRKSTPSQPAAERKNQDGQEIRENIQPSRRK